MALLRAPGMLDEHRNLGREADLVGADSFLKLVKAKLPGVNARIRAAFPAGA